MQTLAVITQDGLSHMNLVGSGTFGRIEANTSGAITTSNTRYYNITDHLGSTREVVNNSGSYVESFDYYPFGLLMPKRNTPGASAIEKFTGKERDTESGLNLDYFGARYYDPAISRFAGVDPRASDLPSWSTYVYTLNNPVNLFDPDGQLPWSIHIRSFISTSTTGGGFFRGDGRGASFNGTSRVRSNFVVDPAMGTVSNVSTKSDPTVFYGARIGTTYHPPLVDVGTPGRSLDTSFSNGTVSLDFSHWGKDPLTFERVTPNLDVHGNFSLTEDLENGVLTVNGSFVGDKFPSTEAFITDQSGVQVFLGAKKESGSILSLFGDNRKPLFSVNMQIMFDKNGNFTGVISDGQEYTVEEWNEEVQRRF